MFFWQSVIDVVIKINKTQVGDEDADFLDGVVQDIEQVIKDLVPPQQYGDQQTLEAQLFLKMTKAHRRFSSLLLKQKAKQTPFSSFIQIWLRMCYM